jgi:putative sterol carrier protein
MYKYLSKEWLECGRQLINQDEEFKKLAGTFSATFYHEVLDRQELNYVSVFKNGHCQDVYLGSIENPTFKISAKYEDWVALHRGDANIINLVIQGRINFEGNLNGKMDYNRLVVSMMSIFPKIPTIF